MVFLTTSPDFCNHMLQSNPHGMATYTESGVDHDISGKKPLTRAVMIEQHPDICHSFFQELSYLHNQVFASSVHVIGKTGTLK